MASWEGGLISEHDFFAIWGAYAKESGDMLFFDEVRNQPRNLVWTITDSGGGRPDHWIASPGLRAVNVLGYVMSRRPWNEETPDAFYSFDDFEWDEAKSEGMEGE